MAQVKTIGEAVRNMSVLMANMYYYLTKAVIEDFGEDAKKSFERGIREFGHERGKKIAQEVLDAGLPLTLENLDRFYDIPIAEGWDLHRTYENDMKMNITDSCTFATVWLEKNWAEVGHIYCLVDVIAEKRKIHAEVQMLFQDLLHYHWLRTAKHQCHLCNAL